MLNPFSRTVTLDITPAAVSLLAVKAGRVDKWAQAPVAPGLMRDGLALDPPALGTRVRQLMKSSGISGKKVVASISGLHSTCRLLRLPGASAGKSAKGPILEAAEATMPLPAEELYLSWQVVDSTAINGAGPLVFVIGTPRSIVDAEVMALRSAGISPPVLNLKILAMMRLVPQRNALVVNMEPDSLDIAVSVDGIPSIVRSLAQPSGIGQVEQVESLAEALEQTVHFYNLQHTESPIDFSWPLFLAGQSADDAEILWMVETVVPYRLAPLAVPLDCPDGLPVSRYAVNIGLAVAESTVTYCSRHGGNGK